MFDGLLCCPTDSEGAARGCDDLSAVHGCGQPRTIESQPRAQHRRGARFQVEIPRATRSEFARLQHGHRRAAACGCLGETSSSRAFSRRAQRSRARSIHTQKHIAHTCVSASQVGTCCRLIDGNPPASPPFQGRSEMDVSCSVAFPLSAARPSALAPACACNVRLAIDQSKSKLSLFDECGFEVESIVSVKEIGDGRS